MAELFDSKGNMSSDPFGFMGKTVQHPDVPDEYVTVKNYNPKNEMYSGKTTKTNRDVAFGGKTIDGGAVKYKAPTQTVVTPKRGTKTEAFQQGKETPKVSEEMSMPTGEEFGTKKPMSDADKQIAADDKRYTDWATAQKAIAAGGFLVDVSNAVNAYNSTKGQLGINTMMARNEAADAIYRGRQAQLDRQSEGNVAGQDASLMMAAQGQDVHGAGVNKIQGSYEAMGYENGAREMLNAYREALGYKLEETNYDYQLDQAGINRDNQITSSFLNTAVTMVAL